jgi:hypothetical protein
VPSHQVFVRLLDEGADVWRPVPAVPLADGTYRLTGARSGDERWEFEPGAVVPCEPRQFGDRSEGLAAISLAEPRR